MLVRVAVGLVQPAKARRGDRDDVVLELRRVPCCPARLHGIACQPGEQRDPVGRALARVMDGAPALDLVGRLELDRGEELVGARCVDQGAQPGLLGAEPPDLGDRAAQRQVLIE